MYSKISVAAFALASLTSTVAAYGSAVVKNQCSQDVYVWVVSNTPGEMQTVASGSSYSSEYEINPDGGGVSIKIATVPENTGAITQFEYTVAGELWYDVSNINGYPFMNSGLTLIPSSSSCASVVCEAGVELCSSAYNVPDDNAATHACTDEGDTTIVLCSGQTGSTPVASASEVASATSTQLPTENLLAAAPSTTKTPASSILAAAVTTSTVAPVLTTHAAGGVATTFVTQVVTIIANAGSTPATTTAAPDAASAADDDWTWFHHPASLGADWGFVDKRDNIHNKRAAHRHHFHRHAENAS